MSAADQLRVQAAALETQAARLRAIAATLDAAAPQARPEVVEKPDRWLDTSRAARIAGVSYMTIYRWCRRYQLGERSSSGSWRINERALRAFLDGTRVEDVQNVHADPLPLFIVTPHFPKQDER